MVPNIIPDLFPSSKFTATMKFTLKRQVHTEMRSTALERTLMQMFRPTYSATQF